MGHPEEVSPPQQHILDAISDALAHPIQQSTYLTSGAAGHIFRLQADAGSYILKLSRSDKPDLFACEAQALRHLASTQSVDVPQVLLVTPAYLVMEDLGPEWKGEIRERDWQELGAQIGKLHSVTNPQFGYMNDNYLGIWDQHNSWTDNWVTFFYENRVLCYLDAGYNKTLITAADRKGIERIVSRIESFIPKQAPSLCHGDLWRNNVYMTLDQHFWVIDPAIYFGLPESDLAMTQMYGIFPEAFYEGYRSSHALDADWKSRLPFYQLKELILMIAQFQHEESLNTLRAFINQYQ